MPWPANETLLHNQCRTYVKRLHVRRLFTVCGYADWAAHVVVAPGREREMLPVFGNLYG